MAGLSFWFPFKPREIGYQEASTRPRLHCKDLVRNDIPPLTRCTLEALIVIFVHNKALTRGNRALSVMGTYRSIGKPCGYVHSLYTEYIYIYNHIYMRICEWAVDLLVVAFDCPHLR